MSDDERDERDKLVVDVADALTLNQEVDWERCARQATAANRRALDNLRLIAGVFAGVRVAGDASTSAGPETRAGVVVRVAVRALLVVAAVEVAAALLLLPWAWEDMRRDLGDLAVFLAFLLVGCSLSACLLLIGGRHDRRTWLLGGYFLLQATSVQPSAMLTYIWGIPLSDLFGYPYTYPFLFAPAFLWAFARECPRVRRRTRLDGLARRMVAVSVVVGCALWVAYVAVLELARAGYLAETAFWWSFDVSLAVLAVLQLAAVAVVVLRARAAPAEEVRRVVLFGSGFLLSAGLVAVHEVVEAFTPGDWLSNYRWSPAAMVVALLRFPGVVLLWYSVLAVRVPHPREVVRTYGRRLLARGRLLALVAATPALTLGWLAASRPERTVGAVLADPAVQSLATAAGVMLLVVVARERLLLRLDTWLYPEIRDQREALAQVTGALARAGQIATVNRTVIRTVGRGCGAPGSLLLAADTAAEAEDFSAPDAKTPPLARTGAIVHMLETAGGWLRVHPNDPTSLFGLLPPADAAWVAAADADAVVPVPGPGAELLGVLVVGRRFDGRTVRPVDMPFLEAVGAAAGLAVARLRVAHGQQARPLEALPAQECPVCRCVTGSEEAPGCDCGFGYVEAEVPKVLAGKFELQRRLGAGGMGAAYLARDLRARARRGGQDPDGRVGLAPDGPQARSLGHGDGDASGRGPDPRHRVVAGTSVPRRRAARRRHARGPAAARAGAGVGGSLDDHPPGRGARGPARDGIPARRHQAEQRRVHGGRVAEASGLRSGPRGKRRGHHRRHCPVSVARGALRPAGRGSRRCLVAVRGAAGDGFGRASVRGRRPRRGDESHPAPTSRS